MLVRFLTAVAAGLTPHSDRSSFRAHWSAALLLPVSYLNSRDASRINGSFARLPENFSSCQCESAHVRRRTWNPGARDAGSLDPTRRIVESAVQFAKSGCSRIIRLKSGWN